jgi:LuxR family maltose regulon positive regulatory protein
VRVLASRGTAELWAGDLGEAARLLESAADTAASAGTRRGRAHCLGRLALVAALRGQLTHAIRLANSALAGPATDKQQPPAWNPDPTALAALATVHVERMELRQARDLLRQADAGLDMIPDRPVQVVSGLMMACSALAERRAGSAIEIIATARRGWSAPAWLEQKLSLVRSRAYVAMGDIQAALAAAQLAGDSNSPASAVALAHVWAAAGDAGNARRALAAALAAPGEVPGQVRLRAHLVEAWLCYRGGAHALGRRSLASALRLAEPEQSRLPFAMESYWIEPVLRRNPELAAIHQRLLSPSFRRDLLPARAPAMARAPALARASAPAPAPRSDQAPASIIEPLTEREREVLRQASAMLTTAEIASELYISINTVKTHFKSIYRKLATSQRGEAVRRARHLALL